MKSERYPSVWNTIANTTEAAGNLRVRTELLEKIDAIVTEAG
jgi:predicted XRE-type DNA-binding protein